MSHRLKTLIAAALALCLTVLVSAHEMTFKGTVAGVDAKRIQVKTGEEKKNETPTWYPIDAKTKITRGKSELTFAQAKIVVGERVVVIVNHESDTDIHTLEIRLAETKAK